MTREEFERDINSWDDLKDFCYNVDCSECDEVESEDTYNEWIEDNLVDWARNETWRDMLSILSRCEDNSGYSWYVWDDYHSEYRHADDAGDFDDYKERVLRWCDENEIWDGAGDEEEEDIWDAEQEEEQDPVDPEDVEPTPEEECTFLDIFDESVKCIRMIKEEVLELERQQGKAYADFMGSVLSKHK